MVLLIPLAIAIVLILTSAFFSGGELALMKLDRITIETNLRKGSKVALLQKRLRAKPQRFLSTILIGYNVANIGLATYAAALSMKLLGPKLGEQQALAVSTVVMTIIITIFAELLPKTLAALNTEGFARWVTYPLYIMDLVLTPVNWLIELVLTPLVKLFSRGRAVPSEAMGREELATALSMALISGRLEKADAAVAREALHFSQKSLGDVMTPRVDVVAVPEDASVGEAMEVMSNGGFSRLPVYRESLDEIIGVLMLKDLVRLSLRSAQSGRDPEDKWAKQPCAPQARQPAFFPESKTIVSTLAEMRQLRVHLAVVIDEHGGTAGVVSLEDIIEELVGDIRDETDSDHSADVIQRGAGFMIVTGRARLESLPELADVDLGELEASTVGGLMLERLGRPAIVGDMVQVDGVRIVALKVLRTQVKLLRIEKNS
jgi:putative hemolysin